jgi:hypothetical protein
MSLIRLAIAIAGLAFAALIVWAIRTGDFWAAGNWLTSDPWGIVTLADLYLGFLLTAVVIAAFEPPLKAAFWIIPLPFLGNVWSVIWFVMALPRLVSAAKAPR